MQDFQTSAIDVLATTIANFNRSHKEQIEFFGTKEKNDLDVWTYTTYELTWADEEGSVIKSFIGSPSDTAYWVSAWTEIVRESTLLSEEDKEEQEIWVIDESDEPLELSLSEQIVGLGFKDGGPDLFGQTMLQLGRWTLGRIAPPVKMGDKWKFFPWNGRTGDILFAASSRELLSLVAKKYRTDL